MMKTMEEEFSDYKTRHMMNILKIKIIDYYKTLEQGQINFMDFLRDDTPEKLAQKDIENLYRNNRDLFFSLYERAYQELAVQGDF